MESENRLIPKIIHQIWIGENKKPNVWMNTYSVDFIKQFPDWQYILWDEEKIKEFGLQNLEFYEKEPRYAVKCDIARYEILNKFGGIYVDADSVWVNNKDYSELIEKSKNTGMFVGTEPDLGYGTIYANGFMGSIPNHEILIHLIKNVKLRYEKLGHVYARHTIVGPSFLTETINEFNHKNVTVFPPIYFYPIFWGYINDIQLHKKINVPPQSYSFQYGYSTSNLKDQINSFDENEVDPKELIKIPHIELEGYKFYSQLDSPFNDIANIQGKCLNDLKNICDENVMYKGFNTNGWIKSSIVHEDNMMFMPFSLKTNEGLYVKLN